MVSNQKIDELLKSLDDTVDSLESGLNCNDETRKIVRDWLASAQQRVQADVESHTELESLVHPKVLTKL